YVISLAVTEAMHMAPENSRPLQEELVLVVAWRVEIRILQAHALELREPGRQVRRVGFGIPDSAVDGLGKVKQEPWVEAPRQACLKIAVEPPGITAPEVGGRWERRIRREATNGPLLTVQEHFCPPDQPAVRCLAEGDKAVCNVDAAQVPLGLL